MECARALGFGGEEFDLVLNYPTRVLSKEDPDATLERMNLNKQEVVHIEKR